MRIVLGVVVCLAMAGAAGLALYRAGLLQLNHPDPDRFRLLGIDVSHHQGRIDWRAVAASAVDGVPQDGLAVFDLPEGYTASSPTLHIVNNIVVPEPVRLVLAGTALLMLAAMTWRLRGRSNVRRPI